MFPVNQARWAEYLRRLINFKGNLQLAALPDAMPTIDLEETKPELQLLSRTRLWYSAFSLTSAAARYGQARIKNPVDSGRLVVIEAVNISSTTQFLLSGVPGPATSQAVLTRERRDALNIDVPLVDFDGTTVAIAPAATDPLWRSGNQAIPLVLSPGTSYVFTDFTANQLMTFSAWGYTRLATPDELQVAALS